MSQCWQNVRYSINKKLVMLHVIFVTFTVSVSCLLADSFLTQQTKCGFAQGCNNCKQLIARQLKDRINSKHTGFKPYKSSQHFESKDGTSTGKISIMEYSDSKNGFTEEKKLILTLLYTVISDRLQNLCHASAHLRYRVFVIIFIHELDVLLHNLICPSIQPQHSGNQAPN